MGNCQNKVQETVFTPSQIQSLQPPQEKFSGLIDRKLTCKSWLRTYNNLFDYTAKEGDDMKSMTVIVKDTTKIIKRGDQFLVIGKKQNIPEEGKGFDGGLHIVYDQKDKTFLYRSLLNSSQNLASYKMLVKQLTWLVVKSLPNSRYAIKQGDIIRLGKQKLKVKQIILKDKQQQEEEETVSAKYKIYNDLSKEASQSTHDKPEQQEGVCRVCLDQGEENNPLIAPCKCTGSAKYIHLFCIQQWLTKSINPRKINQATAITWKPLVCELCSDSLPFKIYIDGKKYFTVKIPRPEKPYLVLNPVIKDQNKIKIYFLVSFSEKAEMMMGRKKQCDIKVSDDASVSRYHTKFMYKKEAGNNTGKFYVEDNGSKYGTLVYLKKDLLLREGLNGVILQIGGDTIKFEHGMLEQNKSKNTKEELLDLINESQSSGDDEEESQEEQVPNRDNIGNEDAVGEEENENAPLNNNNCNGSQNARVDNVPTVSRS